MPRYSPQRIQEKDKSGRERRRGHDRIQRCGHILFQPGEIQWTNWTRGDYLSQRSPSGIQLILHFFSLLNNNELLPFPGNGDCCELGSRTDAPNDFQCDRRAF